MVCRFCLFPLLAFWPFSHFAFLLCSTDRILQGSMDACMHTVLVQCILFLFLFLLLPFKSYYSCIRTLVRCYPVVCITSITIITPWSVVRILDVNVINPSSSARLRLPIVVCLFSVVVLRLILLLLISSCCCCCWLLACVVQPFPRSASALLPPAACCLLWSLSLVGLIMHHH